MTGVIPSSPCGRIQLPRLSKARVEPLATGRVLALGESIEGRYRALIVLAAGAGLRQGEAFGLTMDRVDFLRRTVRVDRQMLTLVGGPPRFGPPKTAASVRVVPLPQVVVDALAHHVASYPPGEDGLVFTNGAGKPIHRATFSRVWTAAARRAQLPAGASFHDLRHYYASLLIQHGESVVVVAARLGHASPSQTLNVYSHLWPDSEDRTRLAVDGVLGNFADYLRTDAAGQG